MQHEIKKYAVRNLLLRNYIKFFWDIRADHMALNHRLIPQRNISLRFNLGETPQYVCQDGNETRLEEVFLSGLQDHFIDARLRLTGKAHVIGVCFLPDGLYPFLKIPVCELKNRLSGADEIGFKPATRISEQLKEAPDAVTRLAILEEELVGLLDHGPSGSDRFRPIFNAIENSGNTFQIAEFCRQHNIGMRKLERMYNKHVGVSAMTYNTLDRFHNSLNRLLFDDYSKLSDIAYEHGYFDQMHYIRDFKRFSGDTPTSFIARNDSMLQVGKLA
jgi:AraC-like DNA-binding protein